jgi:hypothetical protein
MQDSLLPLARQAAAAVATRGLEIKQMAACFDEEGGGVERSKGKS